VVLFIIICFGRGWVSTNSFQQSSESGTTCGLALGISVGQFLVFM